MIDQGAPLEGLLLSRVLNAGKRKVCEDTKAHSGLKVSCRDKLDVRGLRERMQGCGVGRKGRVRILVHVRLSPPRGL